MNWVKPIPVESNVFIVIFELFYHGEGLFLIVNLQVLHLILGPSIITTFSVQEYLVNTILMCYMPQNNC